eukprot:CAMPEP_0203839358 /NCGR_PEP_ID=MMETSP0359-20131031/127_1 /ASSEMBLY_ACC=CAM_ASM_000338 /TAXON_ID=268821 /ORGANISM="Scrippsiella Hangoei, Strain SHTV-5" /LENGTH=552 /DNA_ID=CAMNT_0050753379 /DNA_START=30 /DNA_END=1688 /DNA_ORIENTATION=-
MTSRLVTWSRREASALFVRYAGCRGVSATADVLAAADKTIARTNRLFIDNKYVEAEGSATLSVVSPIDGRAYTTLAHASAGDVDRAVRSAKARFDATSSWAGKAAEERSEVLRRVARTLREPAKLAELCVIESRDCGKTLAESSGDIGFCADVFDYYADIAPKHLAPTSLPLPEGAGGDEDFFAQLVQEPLGVVGCVTPWNYPLMQAVMKVAPALAAGCAIVLKPSPLASLTCCALGEVVAAAGAPPGALNVITGGPPEALACGGSTGQALIDHPLLDKVSFTGSGMAGQKMLEASAKRLRPTSLELGGKSAFVVFDDAEEYLDAVVDWVMVGIFSCTGQVCSATSRLLVHKNIEKQLMERLLTATSKIRVGDPFAEGTQMGPVVSEGQHKRVLQCLERAAADGCTVHSHKVHLPSELQGGFYLSPTVLSNVPLQSSAWREEIFGPVLAVRTFDSEEEAIQMANDTPYGLANAVYSKDSARCARVASQLQSGIVWENCSQVLFMSTPFGGRLGKASGFGHEYGVPGLLEYASPKTVVRATTPGYNWGTYGSA